MVKDFERLPVTIVPLRYHLHLYPNLETFTFAGLLEVELDVKQPTKSILCYAAELEISKASVNNKDAVIEVLTDEERVRFNFEDEIGIGPCRLSIKYTGLHNDKRMGFYRSKSKVSTHFQIQRVTA